MAASTRKIVLGFVAGALAVLVFHQLMYVVLQQSGVPLRGAPWAMNPLPPYGVPRLLNLMFWGGLWGVLFAFVVDRMPGGAPWVKGLIFGLVGPMLLGSWLVVPAIKGEPLFSGAFLKGFDILRLRNGFLLNGVAFGIGLGIIYGLTQGTLATARCDGRTRGG